jgi:hypothetical protein
MSLSTRSSIRRATFALLACLAIAARAEIPGAADPKAFTQRDFARSKYDFDKRTLAGAYQAGGTKDPKWDVAALRLLDATAVNFAYGPHDPVYQEVKPIPLDDVIKLGKAAADAGCTDPLVKYCYGRALADARRYVEAKPLLLEAAAGLAGSKYHPFRIAVATSRALEIMEPRTEVALMIKYRRTSREAAIAALSAKAEDRDLRHMVALDAQVFEPLSVSDKLEFCQAIEKSKDANPWLVNFFYGQYEIKAAWAARGSGWANTVTEAGWQAFHQHLGKARDHLAKAHALHPEFPEAATAMIPVAMGAGDRINEKTRDWFDKAAKAQLDHFPAYSHYLYSIYPRWGGSHEEMIRFALECLATDRFDTSVPYHMMSVLDTVNADAGGDYAVFTDPRVQAAVRVLFTKQIAKAPDAYARGWYASYQVALAWRIGHYNEAATLMDKAGAGLDPRPFDIVGAWAPGAISQIRAMNTTYAKQIAAAERDYQDGEFNAAIVALRGISSKLEKDHPAQLFLKHRAKTIDFQKDFFGGQWVALTPDDNLAPWASVSGDWKLDADGAFVATADATGRAILTCRTEFGPAYELRAKVSSPDPAKPALAALLPQFSNPARFNVAGVHPAANAVVASGPADGGQVPATIKGGELLTVKVEGNTFTVSLDGKPMIADRPLMPIEEDDGVFVALGIVGRDPGAKATFTDVEIRRVKSPNEK